MSSWRIREIDDEIRKLERELYNCTERERYDIRRKIDGLKSELRRLKRREDEEDKEDEDKEDEDKEDEDNNDDNGIGLSILGLGFSLLGRGFGSGKSHGFGGGGFGGGGSGGTW